MSRVVNVLLLTIMILIPTVSIARRVRRPRTRWGVLALSLFLIAWSVAHPPSTSFTFILCFALFGVQWGLESGCFTALGKVPGRLWKRDTHSTQPAFAEPGVVAPIPAGAGVAWWRREIHPEILAGGLFALLCLQVWFAFQCSSHHWCMAGHLYHSDEQLARWPLWPDLVIPGSFCLILAFSVAQGIENRRGRSTALLVVLAAFAGFSRQPIFLGTLVHLSVVLAPIQAVLLYRAGTRMKRPSENPPN